MGTVGAMGGKIAAYNDWISEVGKLGALWAEM